MVAKANTTAAVAAAAMAQTVTSVPASGGHGDGGGNDPWAGHWRPREYWSGVKGEGKGCGGGGGSLLASGSGGSLLASGSDGSARTKLRRRSELDHALEWAIGWRQLLEGNAAESSSA